jgi:pilus assembly protein CpaC
MKTLFIFISLFLFKTSWAASSEIIIEIGQDSVVKKNVSRIWIESSKVISALPVTGGIKLKSLSIGSTRIRINDDIYKVYVVPIGSLKTFKDWSKTVTKFIDLQIQFCDEVVCLKGQIYRVEDFQKIIKLMNEQASTLYFAFDIHPSILTSVQKILEKYQRDKGLTPLRVMFTQPWRVQYSNKELAVDYINELSHIGIKAIESKQKIEIADNIKVSIQVTEVKKEFGRTLGIQYPGSYSAQVLDARSIQQLPFEMKLNASENEGNVKILASPNLVCRSGKEAEFFAGGEFPIRVLNFKVNDVVWKKYGIGLKIKPQIDSIGQMSLQIDSEVSSLDKSTEVDGIPGIQTNKVSSYFDLIKSRTIALSGLIKNEQGQNSEGLPFLRQIPVLGRLFSSHNFRESQSELIIFVTPELLKNETD